jgi:hypothetical protein
MRALPSQGYDGEVPEFPLPRLEVTSTYFDDGQKLTEVDEGASAERFSRENELWCWAWRTPQAAAWALESWRWQSVADWVRMKAHCETSDASAADRTGLLEAARADRPHPVWFEAERLGRLPVMK